VSSAANQQRVSRKHWVADLRHADARMLLGFRATSYEQGSLPCRCRTTNGRCYCGEVNVAQVGQVVTLVRVGCRIRRDHGGMVFIDLRDRSGVVQVRFNPETDPRAHETAGEAAQRVLRRGARRCRAAGPKGRQIRSWRRA
jgi:hypothetical protein